MFALMLGLTLPVGAPPSTPTVREMHEVALRSVPFLKREGDAWIKKRKCVSCHQIPFMIWSLEAMHERGLLKDQKKLATTRKWSIDQTLVEKATPKRKDFATKNVDTIVQLILARDYGTSKLKEVEDLKSLLLDGQQADGSWLAGGQLPSQKRPKRETQEVTTMWALHALSSLKTEGKAREKALAWLKKSKPGKSTEWFVTRLLLAHDQGQPSEVKKWHKQLLAQQNKDGGWSWLRGDKSDAFATGQALYALSKVGLSHEASSIQKAWQFLQSTQEKDGSWQVNSTKEKKKKEAIPTSIYWGTSWAIIGLASSLPK